MRNTVDYFFFTSRTTQGVQVWLSLKSCLLFSNSSYSCLYTTIEAHFPQPSSHLFPAPISFTETPFHPLVGCRQWTGKVGREDRLGWNRKKQEREMRRCQRMRKKERGAERIRNEFLLRAIRVKWQLLSCTLDMLFGRD